MTNDSVLVAIAILCIASLLATAGAVIMAVNRKRVLNIGTLVLANYTLVNLLSGVAHLSDLDPNSRGYFDALNFPNALTGTVLLQVAGAVALAIGLWMGSRKFRESTAGDRSFGWVTGGRFRLSREQVITALVALLIIAPAALVSSVVIQSYAAGLNSSRIIALDAGNARYSYVSNWLVWVLSLAAILLAALLRGKKTALSAFILAVAVLGIVFSLSWTGGRSVVVVMALPLVLVFAPSLRKFSWLLAPIGVAATIAYIALVTSDRSAQGANGASSVVSWLDWQWGRYSMLTFAIDHVSHWGVLNGETLSAGVVTVVLGVFRLVGIPISNPPLRSSVEVAGQSLLGTSDIYIVPGMSSELYLNFGTIGLIVGYIVLGYAAARVDWRFVRAQSPISALWWAYVGTLLVLRTLPADSGSLWAYIVYSGLPLVVLGVIDSRRRGSRNELHKSSEIAS